MPRRRIAKKAPRRRRRVYRRKRRSRNWDKPTTLALKYPDVMPDRKYVKLKYFTRI